MGAAASFIKNGEEVKKLTSDDLPPGVLPEPESEKYTVDVPLPETGFKACYVDLIYRTDDGRQYKISTRIFMTDPGKLL